MEPIIKKPEDFEDSLKIVGEKITVLSSNAESHGYELFIQEGPEGTGPPPHQHEWDESFYVLEGGVEFGDTVQSSLALKGTLVHLPAGTIHWFKFAKGGGKMLSITGLNSCASIFFKQLAEAIPSGEPEVDKLLHVGEENGVKFKLG